MPDSNQPSTPDTSQSSPTQPTQYGSQHDHPDDDDEDYTAETEAGHIPPKGGYDSRVQQILYENPDLDIVITDAGKSSDGGYIVYKIRTGVRCGPRESGPFADRVRILRSPEGIRSSALCVPL